MTFTEGTNAIIYCFLQGTPSAFVMSICQALATFGPMSGGIGLLRRPKPRATYNASHFLSFLSWNHNNMTT